ncbi:Amino acid transporter avt1c, variant 2 [Lathyrus oleraceus]|uniref:Amino acid transporter avt1c, variant 2 n=1 Tax=Pisum sativum TaxID=3888 RepID=A0A9D4WCX6_PEA|nr:Amino acid transporter avt1c, variant 2 [Pisum sativum]
MLEALLWDTECSEKIHSLNSLLTCHKIWLQPRLLSGLRWLIHLPNILYLHRVNTFRFFFILLIEYSYIADDEISFSLTSIDTYALTMSPVAMSLEELIPSNHSKSYLFSIFIRTGLVFSTLVIGLSVPFFGLVMSLIGSLLTMIVSLILPCVCYLRILRGKVTRLHSGLCVSIIIIGVVCSSVGTYSALAEIVKSLSG